MLICIYFCRGKKNNPELNDSKFAICSPKIKKRTHQHPLVDIDWQISDNYNKKDCLWAVSAVLDPFLNAIIVFVILDVMNLYCPIYSALGYACDK